MKYTTFLLIIFVIVSILGFNNASVIGKNQLKLRDKRSPFLRLDELASKLYLTKHKLGAGMVDPLEIGKRSGNSDFQESIENFVFTILRNCQINGECSNKLQDLSDYFTQIDNTD